MTVESQINWKVAMAECGTVVPCKSMSYIQH